MTAADRDIDNLDKTALDYQNRLRELNDKKAQITREGEDEITRIKTQADIARNEKIKAAEDKYMNMINQDLSQVILGHESFAKMMNSIGNQVATMLLQNELKRIETNLLTKQSDGAAAARKAYLIGLGIGGPAGMILGPVFAAGAYASVMAFEGGGIVPGVGRGDIVPAMLEPGEGVLPKQLMDRLSTSGGSTGPVNHYSVHVAPTYHVNTIDGDGMSDALAKHTEILQSHFENTLRKMNH